MSARYIQNVEAGDNFPSLPTLARLRAVLRCDWNELFGHRVVATEFETVAGFVTVLLGHIPRAGDEVRSGPFLFRVHSVRGRRIEVLDLFVTPARQSVEAGAAR